MIKPGCIMRLNPKYFINRDYVFATFSDNAKNIWVMITNIFEEEEW